MIAPGTRRGILLVGGLCLISLWAARQGDDADVGPIQGLDTRLDYALDNFEMLAFDELGRPAVTLRAPRLANDAGTGIGQVESPRAELHHDGFRWNIDAERATVSSDHEVIRFSGQVHMVRNGPGPSAWLDIETSEVTLEVTPRLAYSDRAIDLAERTGTLSADGFRVNMLTNHYHLNENVTGSYVIQAN